MASKSSNKPSCGDGGSVVSTLSGGEVLTGLFGRLALLNTERRALAGLNGCWKADPLNPVSSEDAVCLCLKLRGCVEINSFPRVLLEGVVSFWFEVDLGRNLKENGRGEESAG